MARSDPVTQRAVPEVLERDLGWVLAQVVQAYAVEARDAVADVPGGLRGYQVLVAVADGCPGTQLELGQQLGIDRSVMTNVLDVIEAAKLVERRPDPADRRARRITITTKGQRVRATAGERLTKTEDAILAPLPAKDRAAVRDALRLLAGHFYRGGMGSVAGNPCTEGVTNACTEVPSLEPAAKVWSV